MIGHENWPYTNLHDLNLDWIIEELKNFQTTLNDYKLYFPHIDQRNSGIWSDSYYYEPNTMVYWDNKIYIAEQAVPAGKPITDTDYWLMLADLTIGLDEIREEWDAFREELEERLDELHTDNYSNSSFVYIDGTKTTDGDGSRLNPFNNFDSFLELLNKGRTDIRGQILSNGVYTIGKAVIHDCLIHIAAPNGATLQTTEKSFILYNCHVNFQGSSEHPLIIQHPLNTYCYFENAMTYLVNVQFTGELRCYGGSLNVRNVKANNIWLRQTVFALRGTTIEQNDTATSGLTLEPGCVGAFIAGGSVKSNVENPHSCIECQGGTFLATTINPVQGHNYAYGLRVSYATVFISSGRLYNYAAYSNTGSNDYSGGIPLIVHQTPSATGMVELTDLVNPENQIYTAGELYRGAYQCICSGNITGNGKELWFTYHFPKKYNREQLLPVITGGDIRVFYVNGSGSWTAISDLEAEITYEPNDDSDVRIRMIFNEPQTTAGGTAAVNNSPCTVVTRYIQFTFNRIT